ncbi:MAG: hypothetical protein AB8G22_23230 [Saprospiraceae bacterium]
MKNIKYTLMALLALTIAFSSCDLELQEGFEFVPEVDLDDPFDDLTAWEWLNTRTQPNEEGGIAGESFNYMIAAIEKAGMVDEYNDPNMQERTYLLLNNNAFNGGGDIIDIVTGSPTIEEGATPAEVMENADVDKLKRILQYHIVTTYVAQVPTLFEFNVNYIFQTLIPGDDGIIVMRRDDRYRIDINKAPAPLPSSATSQFERVRAHNYVFLNGIGHIIADPVRNQPY